MNSTYSESRVEEAKRRVLHTEPDREVWVVERNPGSGWRVSAVLASYDEAVQYSDDLRVVANTHPDDFPEKFKHDTEVRIRRGSRNSGTEMWESYPPEADDDE